MFVGLLEVLSGMMEWERRITRVKSLRWGSLVGKGCDSKSGRLLII